MGDTGNKAITEMIDVDSAAINEFTTIWMALSIEEYRDALLRDLTPLNFQHPQAKIVFKAIQGESESGNREPIIDDVKACVGVVWKNLDPLDRKRIGGLPGLSRYIRMVSDENNLIMAPAELLVTEQLKYCRQWETIELINTLKKRMVNREPTEDLNDALSKINAAASTKNHGKDLITLEDIHNQEIEDHPIIDGILYEEETIVCGSGGVGKSLILQNIGMHLAAGKKQIWGGFKTPKPYATLFVQAENSSKALNRRSRKMCRGIPELKDGLKHLVYMNRRSRSKEGGPLIVPQIVGHMSDPDFRLKIVDYARWAEDMINKKIGIIVFDPLISYHDTDENDNSRMRTTLDYMTVVANDIKAIPIVSHHENKAGEMRGASSIRDWARNVIKLEETQSKPIKLIRVASDKENDHEKFDPFTLAMDEDLNFSVADANETLAPGILGRCRNVEMSLVRLGGDGVDKALLIKQYREDTDVKNDSTANKHIQEAVKHNFIKGDLYSEGKIKKARYFLPGLRK